MKILVVEDEIKMANYLKTSLQDAGFVVDLAENGVLAEKLTLENNYNLILLDVMLPKQSGMATATAIRKNGFKGAILMLTALNTTKDKVLGLDAGADDYLTKPFSFEELHARVRALLRRQQSAIGSEPTKLVYKSLELDLIKRSARRDQLEINLTSKEFALLEYLMRNHERPVSRSAIAESAWDIHFDPESNVIDVYVNMLRKKLEAPFGRKIIHTLVGVGYVLKENP